MHDRYAVRVRREANVDSPWCRGALFHSSFANAILLMFTRRQKPAPVGKKATASVKKSAPAKAVPQITVTLKQIAAELAESHNLPKKQAEAVLGDLVTLAVSVERRKASWRYRIEAVSIVFRSSGVRGRDRFTSPLLPKIDKVFWNHRISGVAEYLQQPGRR
jgi:hypothetical protein